MSKRCKLTHNARLGEVMRGGPDVSFEEVWNIRIHPVRRAVIVLDGGSIFFHALARGNDAQAACLSAAF
jgi:hypothetical protein